MTKRLLIAILAIILPTSFLLMAAYYSFPGTNGPPQEEVDNAIRKRDRIIAWLSDKTSERLNKSLVVSTLKEMDLTPTWSAHHSINNDNIRKLGVSDPHNISGQLSVWVNIGLLFNKAHSFWIYFDKDDQLVAWEGRVVPY